MEGGIVYRLTLMVSMVVMMLAFAAPAWAAVSFAGPYKHFVGGSPTDAATGDFNNDSIPDIVTANGGSNGVSVLLGEAGGGYSAPTNYATTSFSNPPTSVAVGDFNGDGDPDLVTANRGVNSGAVSSVSVLLGGAGGTFATPAANIPTGANGTSPTSVTVGDFNGDGDPDLVTANATANNVSVLIGGEGSSFSAPTRFPTGTTSAPGNDPRDVAIGDFNGDGDPDIATANRAHSNVAVLLGVAGTDGFSAPTNFPVRVGGLPQSIAVGDFDGDGDPDLVTANNATDDVSVLLGQAGGGGFSAPTNFTAGDAPVSVSVADFDSDTNPDIAVANGSSNNISVLSGAGAGAFSAPTNFAHGAVAPSSPRSVIVEDVEGDTDPDLVTTDGNFNNVSVFLNGPADTTPPTVSSVTPANEAFNVAIGANVTATFSETMSIQTFRTTSFTLSEQGLTTNIPAQITYDRQSKTATLNPTADLALNKAYIATVTTEVKDESGNALAENKTWTFSTGGPPDTTPPDRPSIDSPANNSFDIDGNITLSGTAEANSTVEVFEIVDTDLISKGTTSANGSGAWSHTITGVTEGTHTYTAKATDAAGNTSLLGSDALNVRVDMTDPETDIIDGPPDPTNRSTATFVFDSEAGATFECSLDDDAFSACNSPDNALTTKDYDNLLPGSHTFEVRAIDTAGNISTPAARGWRIDNVDPTGRVVINGGKASTTNRSVTLRLRADDPSPGSEVTSMRFRNRGTATWSSWRPYATTKAWNLTRGAGNKTVFAQYRDGAGNVSVVARDSITYRH